MTTIWDAISKGCDGAQRVVFFELSLTTGFEGCAQRLDAWSMPLWPSLGNEKTAYEVKVSRSDFLRELKRPEKRMAGLQRSNTFYFVTKDKVVKEESEIPAECGWMLFKDGELKLMKEAPYRECAAPDWPFVRAILRRGFDSEVIELKRKIESMSKLDKERSMRGTHRVVDMLGEWFMTEAKDGNPEVAKKLKEILSVVDLYQWMEIKSQQAVEA